MPLSIKNEEAESLARKVARLTGESMTDAIRTALRERYDRLRRARQGNTLADELNEIALRCARRQTVSQMTEDEILGYDESGIPSR